MHLSIHALFIYYYYYIVLFRIDFKIVAITFKALNGLAPNYVKDVLTKGDPGSLPIDIDRQHH